jgi:hypothetical protein
LQLVNLDGELATGRFPTSWCSADMAEPNPYMSSFALDICRSIALVGLARRTGPLFVIVDDPEFGRALAAVLRDNGVSARWQGRFNPGTPLLKALRAHAGFLRTFARQHRALREHRGDAALLANRKLWLMSWAEGQPAGDTDRFLGALPQWLRSAGLEIGWLRNSMAWLHPIEAIARSVHQNSKSEPAAVVGRFFGIRELLASYGHLLMLPFALKHQLRFGGVDLMRIVRLALRREMRSARFVASALYAGLASSLKRAGLMPRTLFYTYENQPWEKAMLSGFRRAQPGTQLIGVQHAQFSDRYFSGQPSSRQWDDGTTPDCLMTIGSEFRDRLIGRGAPANRIQVGGALRYADLLTRVSPAPKAVSEYRLVLATCSMEARDSFELAYKAAAATSDLPGVRLAINFHPLVDAKFRQTIREQLARFVSCGHVEFVEGGALQWLEQADVLLYNSSSTVLEAAAMRVPAIFVESDVGLDVDVFSGAGSLKCRDVADLRRHIEILLGDAGRRLSVIETASNYMSRCFAPPQAGYWTALAKHATGG